MFQLRAYTLRSADALHRYATVHWARHVSTFETFEVTAGFDFGDIVDVQSLLFDATPYSILQQQD